MDTFVQQLINGMNQGSMYALAALGLALVFGVLRFVHMGMGAVMMIGAYLAYETVTQLGGGTALLIIPALVVASAGGAASGVLVERVSYWRIHEKLHMGPFVSTIGLALAAQEVVRLTVHDGNPVGLPSTVRDIGGRIEVGGVGITFAQIATTCGALGLVAAVMFFIYRTEQGRAIRAVSEDPVAARLVGVDVSHVARMTLAIGSAIAALGGVALALNFTFVTPYIQERLAFTALAAVLLGGLGSTGGPIIAGFILGFAEVFAVGYLPGGSSWATAVPFMAIVVTLLIRPQGLAGEQGQD